MFDNWQWVYLWGIAVALNYLFWIVKSLFDGDESVSTGQQVTEQTTRECETR
jgi:hypothetical protein